MHKCQRHLFFLGNGLSQVLILRSATKTLCHNYGFRIFIYSRVEKGRKVKKDEQVISTTTQHAIKLTVKCRTQPKNEIEQEIKIYKYYFCPYIYIFFCCCSDYIFLLKSLFKDLMILYSGSVFFSLLTVLLMFIFASCQTFNVIRQVSVSECELI